MSLKRTYQAGPGSSWKSRRQESSRTWRLVAGIALAVAANGFVGCSSNSNSSDEDDAFSEFTGTWRVEFGTTDKPLSTHALSCLQAGSTDLPLWDKLVFNRGTVSDLIEVGAPAGCEFAFNVNKDKTSASVGTIDPFTGEAPTCLALAQQQTDAAFYLEILPNPWTFNLLQPQKGQPPRGQLLGKSSGSLLILDTTTGDVSQDTCTYDVHIEATKIGEN